MCDGKIGSDAEKCLFFLVVVVGGAKFSGGLGSRSLMLNN